VRPACSFFLPFFFDGQRHARVATRDFQPSFSSTERNMFFFFFSGKKDSIKNCVHRWLGSETFPLSLRSRFPFGHHVRRIRRAPRVEAVSMILKIISFFRQSYRGAGIRRVPKPFSLVLVSNDFLFFFFFPFCMAQSKIGEPSPLSSFR